jgi:plasmid stabilization system protein ParE
MPRGDKTSYTDKQKRQAGHIEDSYREQGVPKKEAEERAYRTVNKQDGGGKKSGSGRGATTPGGDGGSSKSTPAKKAARKRPSKSETSHEKKVRAGRAGGKAAHGSG